MRYIVLTFAMLAASSHLQADPPPFPVDLVPTPDGYELQWPTRTGYLYAIESSPDLETWIDAELDFPGTGGTLSHGVLRDPGEPHWFHRIKETPDADNAAFLTRPWPGQVFTPKDGIPFAFNLGVLEELPDRILIYKWLSGTTSWELIGEIQEFAERLDVRFPRESTVWLPGTNGEYLVRAVALDAADQPLAQAIRPVSVIGNSPPTVVITGGPPSPSATKQDAVFTTQVSDPENNAIRWVDFYDNGAYLGRDVTEPFGDEISDELGVRIESLWKGTHSITARATDSKGDAGPLSAPYQVVVTGGNSQPTVTADWVDVHTYQGNRSVIVHFTAADPDGEDDLAAVTARHLGSGQTAEAQGPPFSYPYDTVVFYPANDWVPGIHILTLIARDEANASSAPVQVEVEIPGSNALGPVLAAEIADEASLTVSNARFIGATESPGIFTGGLDRGLQMDQGVLLTSGLFSSWDDGDTYEKRSTEWGLAGDDELHARVAGLATRDAAVIEFDVYCPNGQLVIEHQFGTEEYDEYVSQFNDAFLISVDGVPVNLLPDAGDIVGVQSISLLNSRHLFLDDDEDILPAVDPAFQASRVEYDGLTLRLRANALVTPGQTHHVRIVVADVNDYALDAGLFLKSGSLRTRQPQP